MIATILILLVVIEHLFIMVLEMFMIPSKIAKRSFGLSDEFMQQKNVQVMFSNQGLYNGFLAVGLLWAWFIAPNDARILATALFLGFVITAAIWGAITSNKGILIKQGLPAILALCAVLFFH